MTNNLVTFSTNIGSTDHTYYAIDIYSTISTCILHRAWGYCWGLINITNASPLKCLNSFFILPHWMKTSEFKINGAKTLHNLPFFPIPKTN